MNDDFSNLFVSEQVPNYLDDPSPAARWHLVYLLLEQIAARASGDLEASPNHLHLPEDASRKDSTDTLVATRRDRKVGSRSGEKGDR